MEASPTFMGAEGVDGYMDGEYWKIDPNSARCRRQRRRLGEVVETPPSLRAAAQRRRLKAGCSDQYSEETGDDREESKSEDELEKDHQNSAAIPARKKAKVAEGLDDWMDGDYWKVNPNSRRASRPTSFVSVELQAPSLTVDSLSDSSDSPTAVVDHSSRSSSPVCIEFLSSSESEEEDWGEGNDAALVFKESFGTSRAQAHSEITLLGTPYLQRMKLIMPRELVTAAIPTKPCVDRIESIGSVESFQQFCSEFAQQWNKCLKTSRWTEEVRTVLRKMQCFLNSTTDCWKQVLRSSTEDVEQTDLTVIRTCNPYDVMVMPWLPKALEEFVNHYLSSLPHLSTFLTTANPGRSPAFHAVAMLYWYIIDWVFLASAWEPFTFLAGYDVGVTVSLHGTNNRYCFTNLYNLGCQLVEQIIDIVIQWPRHLDFKALSQGTPEQQAISFYHNHPSLLAVVLHKVAMSLDMQAQSIEQSEAETDTFWGVVNVTLKQKFLDGIEPMKVDDRHTPPEKDRLTALTENCWRVLVRFAPVYYFNEQGSLCSPHAFVQHDWLLVEDLFKYTPFFQGKGLDLTNESAYGEVRILYRSLHELMCRFAALCSVWTPNFPSCDFLLHIWKYFQHTPDLSFLQIPEFLTSTKLWKDEALQEYSTSFKYETDTNFLLLLKTVYLWTKRLLLFQGYSSHKGSRLSKSAELKLRKIASKYFFTLPNRPKAIQSQIEHAWLCQSFSVLLLFLHFLPPSQYSSIFSRFKGILKVEQSDHFSRMLSINFALIYCEILQAASCDITEAAEYLGCLGQILCRALSQEYSRLKNIRSSSSMNHTRGRKLIQEYQAEIELLLEGFLDIISAKEGDITCKKFKLLCPQLFSQLLSPSAYFSSGLRELAVDTIRIVVRPYCALISSDESRRLNGDTKALADVLSDSLFPLLLNLLHFRFQSITNSVQSVEHGITVSVLSIVVLCLAEMSPLLVLHGKKTWSDMMLLFGPKSSWFARNSCVVLRQVPLYYFGRLLDQNLGVLGEVENQWSMLNLWMLFILERQHNLQRTLTQALCRFTSKCCLNSQAKTAPLTLDFLLSFPMVSLFPVSAQSSEASLMMETNSSFQEHRLDLLCSLLNNVNSAHTAALKNAKFRQLEEFRTKINFIFTGVPSLMGLCLKELADKKPQYQAYLTFCCAFVGALFEVGAPFLYHKTAPRCALPDVVVNFVETLQPSDLPFLGKVLSKLLIGLTKLPYQTDPYLQRLLFSLLSQHFELVPLSLHTQTPSLKRLAESFFPTENNLAPIFEDLQCFVCQNFLTLMINSAPAGRAVSALLVCSLWVRKLLMLKNSPTHLVVLIHSFFPAAAMRLRHCSSEQRHDLGYILHFLRLSCIIFKIPSLWQAELNPWLAPTLRLVFIQILLQLYEIYVDGRKETEAALAHWLQVMLNKRNEEIRCVRATLPVNVKEILEHGNSQSFSSQQHDELPTLLALRSNCVQYGFNVLNQMCTTSAAWKRYVQGMLPLMEQLMGSIGGQHTALLKLYDHLVMAASS